MQNTAGEARTNSLVTFFYGPIHMDEPMLANKQGFANISSVLVRVQDEVGKTIRERWVMGKMAEERFRKIQSI